MEPTWYQSLVHFFLPITGVILFPVKFIFPADFSERRIFIPKYSHYFKKYSHKGKIPKDHKTGKRSISLSLNAETFHSQKQFVNSPKF